MELERIREALQDRMLTVVSRVTDIHYNTLRSIRSGQNTNPHPATLKVLAAYLFGREGTE